MKLLFLLFLSSFSLSTLLFAQEPPVKWGDIPLADLKMSSFPSDTNASALILSDYGQSYLDNDLNIVYKRHLRVKIFNEKGYKWGNHSVMLYTSKRTEFIEDIKGMTYTLDEQGQIIKSELDDDDIFEEEVDDERTAYNLTLPSLKPGCVIELSYKITSEHLWFMRDWDFQHDEPVRWSEYIIRCPTTISYAILSLGFEQYAVTEYDETTQVFSGAASAILHETIVDCYQYRWAVKNAPAIRDEQFITTVDDYKNKIIIQLSAYSFNGEVKKFLNDWKSLANELIDNKAFGELIDDTRKVKKLCNTITANCSTDKERVEALHDWISKSIVCTGRDVKFGDQEPDDVIETKKGSNADITFLFLSLLKFLKIEADPVLVSTRDHGKVRDIYPMVSQFNYVLSRVLIDSQYVLIDPTDPLRPMGLLPFRVLNTKALIIREDKPEWTLVVSPKYDNEAAQTRITIKEDGSISGMSEALYSDYAAFFLRKKLQDKTPSEIAADVFDTEKYGIEIDSVIVTGIDSIKANALVKIWFSSEGYAQSSGDIIYINPFLINRITNNPLKSNQRKFPLDFGLRSSSKVVYTLTIPDGFEVKEMPKNKMISPNLACSFDRKAQNNENQIQIMDKFDIKEVELKPQFYQTMRQFYSRVIEAHSEQIVLQRKSSLP